MIVIDGKRYLSTVEAALKIGCASVTMRLRCKKGLIDGAMKMTRRSSWMIPIDEIEKRALKSTEIDHE